MTYTFQLTREQLEAKRLELAHQYGIQIHGDSGEIDQDHFIASVAYSADSQTLTINVTAKPFLLPWSAIQHQLQSALGGN